MRFLLYSSVLVFNTVLVLAIDMDTVYRWKYIDYVWDSENSRQQAIESGVYDYTQVIPMDVDKAPDGRVFVTFLGAYGAPAVLGTVTNQMGPSGPLIKPYPDWSYFKRGDCDSIRNLYRIAIDKCERLWVLDNGYVENEPITCGSPSCVTQLLVFDLKTDRLIERIKIPEEIAKGQNGQSLLSAPIVETYGRKCEDTIVYVADAYGHGLIIWNNGNWSRLENPVFHPSVGAADITSGGLTVQWNAGIVTMDITPEFCPGEERFLYFHSLSSFDLHGASIEELKRSRDGTDVNFIGAQNVLSSQAVGIAFASEGILFMGLTKESAIACWNRNRKLEARNILIVAEDNDRLQYVNGMKVIRGPNMEDEELWVLSNRFVAYAFDKYNFSNYNFHILKSPVRKLSRGTTCE